MNRLFKFIIVFNVLALLVAGYQIMITRAADPLNYQIALYESLNNQIRESFFVAHHCNSVGSFRLCPESGLAFQVDTGELVRQVYFYVHGRDGFSSFSGKLPFGLELTDTMADVQQKLGYPKMFQLPMLGWEPGLPDRGTTPDHVHYWAEYKRYGLTIVYNTPSATDLKADIYLILASTDPMLPMYHGRAA